MLISTPSVTPMTPIMLSNNKQQPSAEKLNVAKKARRRLFLRERKVLLPYTKRLHFSPDSSFLPKDCSNSRQGTTMLEWSGDESSPIKIVNKTIDLEASTELCIFQLPSPILVEDNELLSPSAPAAEKEEHPSHAAANALPTSQILMFNF
jgi:hypothetical protein